MFKKKSKQALQWLKFQGFALILVGIILLPYTAEAKVVAYVTKDNENKLYEFDYNELVRAFVFSSSTSQPMYHEFLKGEIVYLLDDVNGYVDYYETVRAFVFSSGNFDLNAYTSGPQAKIVTVEVVNVVTVENGKLKFTEKVIADPVRLAMIEVNAASDAPSLRIVLESLANVLGLSLSKYNQLSDYGKSLAAAAILQRKNDGFADAPALKTVFDEEVQVLFDNPVAVVLHELNSVTDAISLRNVLVNNANLLDLDLSTFSQFLAYCRTAVADSILQRKGDGFAEATLKLIFDEEVQSMLSYLEQVLESVNTAENLSDLNLLLLEHGKAFELELAAYVLIISSRTEQVLAQVSASGPYETADSLKKAFNDSVAATLKSYVVISYSKYNLTVPEMVDIQMSLSAKPQWWVSGQGWRDAPREEVQKYVDPANFVLSELISYVTEVIITIDDLKVYETPTTEGNQLATVQKGQIFTVEDLQKALEGTAAGSEGFWFQISVDEVTGWIFCAYTDWVAENYSSAMFQFINLAGPSGVTQGDLGLILNGKGILSGTEKAFYQASQENNINEIFLTSLSLHETGNGTSTLANGQLFEGQIVYNMFGIGAYDSNPNYFGAKYAYEQGWFTPELAIIGGARFASRNYVNHSTYRQDTLYKMRWNPGNPGKHQYATDVAWASKQTSFIRQLYNQVNMYNLRFDIPQYKIVLE